MRYHGIKFQEAKNMHWKIFFDYKESEQNFFFFYIKKKSVGNQSSPLVPEAFSAV